MMVFPHVPGLHQNAWSYTYVPGLFSDSFHCYRCATGLSVPAKGLTCRLIRVPS